MNVTIFLYLGETLISVWASQAALVVKNPPANAGDIRDTGSNPGSGRSPGGGNGNTLQYSCLENLMGNQVLLVRDHKKGLSRNKRDLEVITVYRLN